MARFDLLRKNRWIGFGAASLLVIALAGCQRHRRRRGARRLHNAGVKQAQAISASLASLLDMTKAADGPLSGPDANGYYTATLLGTGTKKFPVGAKMRAVALQGYFTQVSPAAARGAISVVKEVTGDAVRRKVVDPEKCSNCHEWFEGHGGNRVYQTQVCVMCHVPGLATSGRQIPDTTMNTWNFTGGLLKIVNSR